MSRSVAVPFADLPAQNRECAAEFATRAEAILSSGRFIGGPDVEGFERAFAAYLGSPHVVAVSSGTAALLLALKALGIGPGHEVITPANSFAASAAAIHWAGARPVLADVDPATLLVDPADVERRITPRTRALLPVHLYGQVADMTALGRLAAAHDLRVVEDACQAHGARANGTRAGAMSEASAFSFYPAKNLGAPGDGGAVAVRDARVAAEIRSLADHGRDPGARYEHRLAGFNFRMNSLPAAFLSAHLPRLEARNEARRRAAAVYDELLSGIPEVRRLARPAGTESVHHLYVVRVPRRDELRAYLSEHGIETGIHYPVPIHLLAGYAHLGYRRGDFPVTEEAAREILSLPMFPTITTFQVETVVGGIRNFYGD